MATLHENILSSATVTVKPSIGVIVKPFSSIDSARSALDDAVAIDDDEDDDGI